MLLLVCICTEYVCVCVTESHISVFREESYISKTPTEGNQGKGKKGLQESLSDEACSPPGSNLQTFTENSLLLCCPEQISVWMEATGEQREKCEV